MPRIRLCRLNPIMAEKPWVSDGERFRMNSVRHTVTFIGLKDCGIKRNAQKVAQLPHHRLFFTDQRFESDYRAAGVIYIFQEFEQVEIACRPEPRCQGRRIVCCLSDELVHPVSGKGL